MRELANFAALCGGLTIYWAGDQPSFQMLGFATVSVAGWWAVQAAWMAARAVRRVKCQPKTLSDTRDDDQVDS